MPVMTEIMRIDRDYVDSEELFKDRGSGVEAHPNVDEQRP